MHLYTQHLKACLAVIGGNKDGMKMRPYLRSVVVTPCRKLVALDGHVMIVISDVIGVDEAPSENVLLPIVTGKQALRC